MHPSEIQALKAHQNNLNLGLTGALKGCVMAFYAPVLSKIPVF